MKIKIKKEDQVLILSGNHKGTKGIVKIVFPKKEKAIISGINIVKRHTKSGVKNPKGGIIEKESPIHLSNLKKIENKS
ncbi:50S ribosomal protein L24 [Blattabacterium cuenoti]|uniref:50S ribosomal protein L24 n=1 Tax=Blattabacterium cuenoti TaxID=1653831 RepID=UPI00163D242F|nr:50S ribosomal protein L24 [Blattabacterium cuenoti]